MKHDLYYKDTKAIEVYVDKRIDKENVANVESGIGHLPEESDVIGSNINVPRISHLHECVIICSI